MPHPDPERRTDLPEFDPERPRPAWRRWLRRVLLAILVLAAAGFAAGWFLLRTDSGRQWTLRRVSSAIEDSSGWRVGAHDFSLRLRPGRLVLQGVRVGAPDSEPLVAVDRAEVDFAWSELRGRPLVLDAVSVRGVVVDTAAPTPRREPTDDGTAEVPLAIRSLKIDDAEVLGGATEGWLETWSVRDLALSGSIQDGGFDATLRQGILRLARRDADDLDLDLSGRARGPFEGPYTLEKVDVEGDGLDVEGSGTAGLGEAEPLQADFNLRADAGRLLGNALPSIAAPRSVGDDDETGVLSGQGSFDFRRLTGNLELTFDDLPSELFEPLVGSETLDRVAARGTRLDGRAKATISFAADVAAAERVQGEARLTWRKGTEPLIDLEVYTLEAAEPADPVGLEVEASLLPAFQGKRRVEASLRVPSWTRLAEVRSDVATVRLDVPELGRFRDLLQQRWPGALDAVPVLPWQGRLDLRAQITGDLRNPRIEGDATWRPDADAAVRVTAKGRPLSARATAQITTEGFELASLRPSYQGAIADLRGRLDGRLDVDLGGSDANARANRLSLVGTLEAADVVLQLEEGAPRPDLVARRLSFDGDASMPWTAAGEAVPPTFEGLAFDAKIGVVELEMPTGPALASVEADARLHEGDLRIRHASGRLLPPLAADAEDGSEPKSFEDPAVLVTSTAAEETAQAEVETGVETEVETEAETAAETPAVPRRFGDPIPFELAGSAAFLGDRPVTEPLIRSFDLRLAADRPHRAVERLVIDARLQEGALGVDVQALDLPEGAPTVKPLTAYLPLADLARVPGLDVVDRLPVAEREEGPLRIAFEISDLDTGGVARWLGQETPAEQLRSSVRGSLHLRPDDPTASTGEIEMRDTELVLAENTFRSAEPQTLSLENRRLRLERGLWQARNRTFDAEAEAKLRPRWQLDQPLAEALDTFSAVATGSLEAALLNGYLAGGRAQGLADVTVLAAGTLDDNAAEIDIVGDENTSLTWVQPYATRISTPTVRLRAEDGVISVTEATARLNEGRLDVEGTVLDPDGATHLSGFLDSIRYRLDYGLTVLLTGNFDVRLFPDRPGELQANILVERGFLRRQIDPDREVINLLLQPPELDMGDASDLTRQMRLDLDVATVEGVRVKNNVADLHASWAPIEVGGTLAEPFLRGSVEVDPGGKVYAWGQVVRLDRAVMEFSGQSDVPARLDLTTTSSLEDPSIASSDDRRLIADMAEPVPLGSVEAENRRFDSQAFTSGLTTYYGDQLASRLGAGLAGPRIEYRPLRIFGESSPEAKLVVSQDLSSNVSLSAAFGLREAEDRTYLVEFHELPILRSMSATAFTTDEIDYGATLQQMLRLGGAEDVNEEDLPRLDDIVIRCPACVGPAGEVVVKERKIRRAVGFRENDLIPEGSDFDVEVDVEEALRNLGFPEPRVRADVEPDKDPGHVDIELDVDLGPQAHFEFSGEMPPRNRRDSIRSLYRVDYYEETSIEEMRQQTERVWKSLGYPEPKVNVRAERLDADDPASDRRVIVDSAPGHALELESVSFQVEAATGSTDEHLSESTKAALANRFASLLWQTKLAAGDEDADARLLRALSAEGYPRAEIATRELVDEESRLVVRLQPGPRRQVTSLAIEGLDAEGLEAGEAARARDRLELAAGDPFVSARVAEQAVRLESDLRSRGYYEARVVTEISEVSETEAGDLGDDDLKAAVRFVVEPGQRYVLGKIEVRGANHTRETWIHDITGLEPGAPLDRRKVAEARRKLIETRLFKRVTVDAQHAADGTTLVFDLVEKPRFELSYGGRWESEGGFGGIFEALDNNFTGRGVDLGLRVLYAENEERLRFYGRVPRLFDRGVELELFTELFSDEQDRLQSEGWEATGQLRLKLRPKLEGRVYSRFVDQELTDLTAEVPVPERERTPTVGVQLVWDTRDRLLDPNRGLLLSLDLSGAREIISDEDEYLRFYGQVNGFVPLTQARRNSKPWVWSQSLRLGLSETDSELPRSVRFFAGGPFSVRGYRDRTLGPQEQNDDGSLRARGGQALLVLNQELRFPLPWYEGLQGVAFVDAGNVWLDVGDISVDDLFTAAGLGMRAQTPVGIVRLDVGIPLNGRLQDDDYELYFGFGHSF